MRDESVGGRRRTVAAFIVFLASFDAVFEVRAFAGSGDGRTEPTSIPAAQGGGREETGPIPSRGDPVTRRRSIAAAMAVPAAALSWSGASRAASALERTFPDELTDLDPEVVQLSATVRLNSQQRTAAAQNAASRRQATTFDLRDNALPSLVWGGALWLLSGSRSNPITTPLANLLYDSEAEDWLRDRNKGLFAPPPAELLLLLGFIYVCLGIVAEILVLQLAGGDVGITSQLAGVSLLNGLFLELGRIASGEKGDTREENDRNVQLRQEFQEFASKRLVAGGSCHKTDVVKAFRRFFAKYRQRDSEDYPLTDLEIEKLLKAWNKVDNALGQAEMTSSGFYYGFSVNQNADVFY